MSTRLTLPSRRNHITQKVRIANQRTLYISVHDDPSRDEIFVAYEITVSRTVIPARSERGTSKGGRPETKSCRTL